MIPQISDAELVLMKLLWRQGGSALYAELMEAPDIVARGWQKNTVITLLARLGEKGLVTAEKLGRRNRYTAAVRRNTRRPRPGRCWISSTRARPGAWC